MRIKLIVTWISIILICIIIGLALQPDHPLNAWFRDTYDRVVSVLVHEELPEPEIPEEKDIVAITISAIGDCVLGSDYRYDITKSFDSILQSGERGYDYYFMQVKQIFAEDDLTIANLESTLTTRTTRADKSHQERAFWFRGLPAYAKILELGNIEVVNLANNHTHDYGEDGYQDTIHSLNQSGIGYFGYDQKFTQEIRGVHVTIFGYNQLGINEHGVDLESFYTQILTDIETARPSTDLIIVSIHWGMENEFIPEPEQVRLARAAIDAGADLILGHHSHTLQGIESYKDKNIIYSLGNFVYGGAHFVRDDGAGIIYQETFTFEDKVLVSNRPNLIAAQYSGSKEMNDFQPRLASTQEKDHIIKKVLERSLNLKYTSLGLTENQIDALINYRRKVYESEFITIGKAKLVDANRTSEYSDLDMVDLSHFIPGMEVELNYGTVNNFTGEILYHENMAYSRLGTAKKLKAANEMAMKRGYRIKLWDAYRPPEVQWLLWQVMPNPMYIGNPNKNYSSHNRGQAVDVTLIEIATGNELDMPSSYDDFSSRAHRDSASMSDRERNNMELLEYIMATNGLLGINSEWWHYYDADQETHEVIDIQEVLFMANFPWDEVTFAER